MMAATCRPLPQPVPSPSIQPRRKRTGSDRVSPSWVTREVSTSSSFPSSSSLRRWTVSHWEPMRYSAARCREWASPASTTLSSCASDSRPSVTMRSGSSRAGRPARDAARRPWRRTGPAASGARPRPAPARRPAATARRGRGRWPGWRCRHRRPVRPGRSRPTSSETGPQSWDRRVSGVDTGLGPRRFSGLGATGLPNRSRAGPAGTGDRRDRLPIRHLRDNRIEQLGGVARHGRSRPDRQPARRRGPAR